jgi:basic membrane protein A
MKLTNKLHTLRHAARIAMIGIVAAAGIAGTAMAADPVKIGYVYVSPIGDAGWTFQHDKGRKEMETALAGQVKSTFIESVPEGADAERVIRELAQSGNKVVFATSFGYMNPMEKVAKAFPNTVFLHATGYKMGKNMGIYNARFYEGRYVNGVIAGKMTKSNVLGYVAAFPIPEVLQGINAFTLGARSVNPKAVVRVIWVNSWFDPGKEGEAANTLIAQGADVLTHHTDSTAVVQAAEAKGKYAFGYHSDMSKYGPKAHLSATVHEWGDFYTRTMKAVIAGTWKPENVWGGFKDGMIRIAPMNPVIPKDVQAQVNVVIDKLKAGSFHPFTGPLKTQAGKEVLAAGKQMSDDEISKINYYVEGVESELPKK